jgi:SAM-dependent methyltransferase
VTGHRASVASWVLLVAAAAGFGCAAHRDSSGQPPSARTAAPLASPSSQNPTASLPAGEAGETVAADAGPSVEPPDAETRPVKKTMPDVAYWATPQPVVDKMLRLARVTASDLVYDLGCGDARSLVTAAQKYGARGVGIDIDPALVEKARENVRRAGVEDLVRIERADIFEVDVSPATVVFLYMVPRFNLRLVPQLKKLGRGSRIVSHEFEIPSARPTRVVRVAGPPDGPPEQGQKETRVPHRILLFVVPWKTEPTEYKLE